MFENELAVNEALIRQFAKTADDVPEELLFHPCVGHGHPPVWIFGHLAIIAEMGQSLIGGTVTHPAWIPMFGPKSSDIVASSDDLTKASLRTAVKENYRNLRSLAATVDPSIVSQPHSVELLLGSPVKTIGHVVSLILTSHFGFHLGQLSSCRRTAGFGPLF